MKRPSATSVALLTVIVALLLPAATNVATNALPSGWGRYLWLAWPTTGILAAVVVVTEVRRHRKLPEVELLGFRFTQAGRPPNVGDIDAVSLGVKPSISTDRSFRTLPAYVPRDCDADLVWAFQAGGLVVLHGPSASGKSRSAFEAIQRLKQRALLVPATSGALRHLIETGHEVQDAVVWLDDIEKFLNTGDLDVALLDRLCPSDRSDVVLVCTIRDEELKRFDAALAAEASSAPDSVGRAGEDVIRAARAKISLAGTLSDRERLAAEPFRADPRIDQALRHPEVGFVEYLAAGPQLLRRWRDGAADSVGRVGSAIISASVDFLRAGFRRPLREEILKQTYEVYLPAAWRRHPDLAPFSDGLAWARRPVAGASACLNPVGGAGYLASDYLLDRFESPDAPHPGQPVPDAIWHAALDAATPEDALSIGVAASDVRRDVATEAFRRALLSSEPAARAIARYDIGIMLRDDGQRNDAEDWFRQAAEAGHVKAMTNLGALLDDRGAQEEAERWWRRAARGSDAHAMHNLANLARNEDHHEAERWYRLAATGGYVPSMCNLGALLIEQGQQNEAEQWWRRAADLGEPVAMHNLGQLVNRRGDSSQAEQWFRRAIAAGRTEAMVELADLLAEQEQPVEADQWYQRAAEAGEPAAMIRLGLLNEQRAMPDEALAWYQRAAEAGDLQGMVNAGFMLHQRGQPEAAERWLRTAADSGELTAMGNLGALLAEQDRREEAERWLQLAADAGAPAAMSNLARLLADRGETDAAERWLHKAADAGHVGAFYNLGLLYEELNQTSEAERWYRRAADADDPQAMTNLGLLLADRGDIELAEQWWRRAAGAGVPEAIENLEVLTLQRLRGQPTDRMTQDLDGPGV